MSTVSAPRLVAKTKELSRSSAQLSFVEINGVSAAVARLALAGVEERGAIFTKPEVVDFMLDIAGYTADKPLHKLRLLEPSFGEGDFLLRAAARLMTAFRVHAGGKVSVLELKRAISGIELHKATFNSTRSKLIALLCAEGCSAKQADTLASVWLSQQDFLLSDHSEKYTHVVGNPPYVRQELIADVLMSEYRTRFSTIYDRADLYIPFIEHSLALLAKDGHVVFICADRWMKNRYGRPLRKLVADRHSLDIYVDMVDTDAFHSDVIAYPAIVRLSNAKAGTTALAHRPPIDGPSLSTLAASLLSKKSSDKRVQRAAVATTEEPWVLEHLDRFAIVQRIEGSFPTLEEAGCKVGIGVATGNDKVFIAKFDELDVEDERKLPLVMSKDIAGGTVRWKGYGILNPFEVDGSLASFSKYPRFAKYLTLHGDTIKKRHVSQKNPTNWYRTIDRIYPSLAKKPKLLLPDIKGEANLVYEDGELYPHHNLYFITSDTWDLRALQMVLLSGIANLFVATYSTKMQGGYLRFQAQYLRRIRLPLWENVPKRLRKTLIAAAEKQDQARCALAIAELYGLSAEEHQLVLKTHQ